MNAAVEELLEQVIEWLGVSSHSHLKNVLLKVLEETYPEWEPIAQKAIQQGSKSGLKLLEYQKKAIIEVCMENEALTAALIKFGGKTVGRMAAEIATKQTSGSVLRMVLHSMTLSALKRTASTTAKTGAATTIEKTLLVSLGSSAVNPMAIGADFLQGILEYCGKPKLARGVGMAGNIGANAVFGLAVGGPMGAAVGAMCGAGLWYVGEFTGHCIDKLL